MKLSFYNRKEHTGVDTGGGEWFGCGSSGVVSLRTAQRIYGGISFPFDTHKQECILCGIMYDGPIKGRSGTTPLLVLARGVLS